MNKARRIKLSNITKSLNKLMEEIEDIEAEEDEAFDNLPDSIASTERGDQMQEFIALLNESRDDLESAIEKIEEVHTTEQAIG